MLEIAFGQVEAMLQEEEEGLEIVGYYQANEHQEDNGKVSVVSHVR